MDTDSFSRAMRRVLRQDPDVILIGEMRDEETVRTALSAAETGHLVLSTVHTLDAPESVNRIIDFFPPHEQNQARAMLAGTLQGRRLPAPRPDPRRQRPRGRVRDPADDRARARHDHRPRADRPPARGDRRGRVLRDADLRPGAAAPLPGRAGVDGGCAARCLEPARLQAAGRRRRPDRDVDGRHLSDDSPRCGPSGPGDAGGSTTATASGRAARLLASKRRSRLRRARPIRPRRPPFAA